MNDVLSQIGSLPALVFAGETRKLKEDLASAADGSAFVLQCGDCAEEFQRCTGPRIHALLKVMLQMSIVLAFVGERRVVNIGRIAGQFVKPRSSDFEVVNGSELPVYRGDMVNGLEATAEARRPDPQRILQGYFRSAVTLNLVRAFTRGGYASVRMAGSWHEDFSQYFGSSARYLEVVQGIEKSRTFLRSMGLEEAMDQLDEIMMFTSHEALLLAYEEALTRIDTTTGEWYDTSAHMVWVGDRTRQLGGAHIEFLRGIRNPVGVKVGPSCDPDELLRIAEVLNPENEAGRLVFITRFGAARATRLLRPLLQRMREHGRRIVWMCDPMHGNTFATASGRKTRRFDDIVAELAAFFDACAEEGVAAGGVHLEVTGDAVTECLGGMEALAEGDLEREYLTACDPRLNARQSVELAFEIAELLKARR